MRFCKSKATQCLTSRALTTGSSTTAPPSTTPRGRLNLLEWSVLSQRDELLRAKRCFTRDLSQLQAALLDRSAELEEAERRLVHQHGTSDAANNSGRSATAAATGTAAAPGDDVGASSDEGA